MLEVLFLEEGKTLKAVLTGEIDHHSAQSLREQIDEKIASSCPRRLILDFKGISFMDSSGIGLVMGRYNTMQTYGGEVEVIHLNDHFYKIMKLSGLEQVVTIRQGEKEE